MKSVALGLPEGGTPTHQCVDQVVVCVYESAM